MRKKNRFIEEGRIGKLGYIQHRKQLKGMNLSNAKQEKPDAEEYHLCEIF